MYKVKFICQFIEEYINNVLYSEIPIIIYVDILPRCIITDNIKSYHDPYTHEKLDNSKIYMFLQIESYIIISSLIQNLLNDNEMFNLFTKILTYDNNLLNKDPKCIKFLPYENFYWCKSPNTNITNLFLKYHGVNDSYSYENKNFIITFTCGHKNYCPGHRLRHILWNQQDKLLNVKCYYSKNNEGMIINQNNIALTHPRDKTIMYENNMFCISIENNKSSNYFTEKLIECIVSKTVPIYWGCPNINEYFNTKGFIIFNDENELFDILKNLTEKDYYDRLEYINENYNKWVDNKSFEQKLIEIIKNI